MKEIKATIYISNTYRIVNLDVDKYSACNNPTCELATLLDLSLALTNNCEIFELDISNGKETLIGHVTVVTLIYFLVSFTERMCKELIEAGKSLIEVSEYINFAKRYLEEKEYDLKTYERIIEKCNNWESKNHYDESKDFALNSIICSIIYCITRLVRIHSNKTWDIYTIDLYVDSLIMLAKLGSGKKNFVLDDVADNDCNVEYIKQGNFVLDFLKSGKYLFYM